MCLQSQKNKPKKKYLETKKSILNGRKKKKELYK